MIHDDAVSFDGTRAEFAIEVTVAGSPVEAATVCLMTEGDGAAIYEVVETDAAGRAVIVVDECEPAEAQLTITAHNCVPYGATVTLGGTTSVDDDAFAAGRTELQQNYPNPFNPRTRIAFALGQSERARIEIYDVAGRLVSVLLDETLEAGEHSVEWNGTDSTGSGVASGTYFVRMLTGGSVAEKKMVLMR
ncbi:T9SS type A sorting domain-containing protein [bacterium]|nr:T9SS type A sorting domain-containing protein [bacterium]